MSQPRKLPPGYERMRQFPLIEALLGRRSRRFFRGAEIPDGVFAYRSKYPSLPLDDLETLLVVAACTGNTSWHHMIYRAERYAPQLSNYAAAASGRTFPSAAGFHASKTFFTNDSGVYLVDPSEATPYAQRAADGTLDADELLEGLSRCIHKVDDGRLSLPSEAPFVEPHNTWVVNHPGTLLVIPVGDLAQHVVLDLCYMLQNGLVAYDDIHQRAIPGLEEFHDLAGPDDVWPLTFVEQTALGEMTAEISASCYAGALMLQAMGLGGWMFNGIDPFSILGASGDPRARGLGFRYDEHPSWPYPNATGREGVMEAACPPHVPDMRAAVDRVYERKFGPGGPFHPLTPGPWRDSRKVRSAATPYDERFRTCVALQAQYMFDTFGKFPATVPSMYVQTYVHAFHLDLDFYDTFYEPGAYLDTHRDHMDTWHGDSG